MNANDETDFASLDDSALLSTREQIRADAGHGPRSAEEHWAMDARARLLAVEVLLADPEALGNDALEADLYILRDQLLAGSGNTGERYCLP